MKSKRLEILRRSACESKRMLGLKAKARVVAGVSEYNASESPELTQISESSFHKQCPNSMPLMLRGD